MACLNGAQACVSAQRVAEAVKHAYKDSITDVDDIPRQGRVFVMHAINDLTRLWIETSGKLGESLDKDYTQTLDSYLDESQYQTIKNSATSSGDKIHLGRLLCAQHMADAVKQAEGHRQQHRPARSHAARTRHCDEV